MSYAAPRKAKTKKELVAKVIGKGETKTYKAGKACSVMRNPSQPGMFIVYFTPKIIAQVRAEDMPETIEYTDGKPDHWQ